jgi:hypothetical protein
LATYHGRYYTIGLADLRAVSTDQSRTFSYTILAEEVVPIAPVVGISVVRITIIIGISVLQRTKRSNPREK